MLKHTVMDKYEEVTDYIKESIVKTITLLMDTGISNSAFLNASYNIGDYKDKQLEKCGFFKNSPHCLAKIKAMTKETLELIVVNSKNIKEEEALAKTVRVLEDSFKIKELRK